MTPTKEVLDEIQLFNQADEIRDKFHKKLLKIIKETTNSHIDEILSVSADEHSIHVYYEEICYGCRDRDTCLIPTYWLNKDFDYVSDSVQYYKKIREELELEQKQKEEAEEKAEYMRLKKKFEES